jgi:glycosyltransferase involved in cell wall biosynthesis
LKKIKGIDILIDAACILANQSFDFHLTIAGKPWDLKSEDLIDKIKSNNLEKFISIKPTFISDEEKDELYEKSDVVILPYKKIYNSAVLMLTASMNKPLIVSDLGPFTDILENEVNGLIFKKNDAKDLANKILNINLPKMDIFADRLFDKVELEYSWERITTKLIDSYKKVIIASHYK